MTTTGELEAPSETPLLGSSVATLHLHGEIALVAPHAVPVLVLGETGVGKEGRRRRRQLPRRSAQSPVGLADPGARAAPAPRGYRRDRRRLLARRQAPPLSADAAKALVLHDWPGNVREFERELAAALIRASGAPPRADAWDARPDRT